MDSSSERSLLFTRYLREDDARCRNERVIPRIDGAEATSEVPKCYADKNEGPYYNFEGPGLSVNFRYFTNVSSVRFLLLIRRYIYVQILTWLPIATALPSRVSHNVADQAGSTAQTIRSTWQNPSDTLSILLIIGGDVIARALAQLSGRKIAPVAFSFGWVTYAFATLVNIFGDGRLMPAPDFNAKVFNVKSGISRDNRSWVLARLLRDMRRPLISGIGMNLSIYRVVSGAPRSWDWCDATGFALIPIQLAIAAIPCGLFRDWSILIITAGGILLSLATGALPQWRLEKYSARSLNERKTTKVIALTGGNGSSHVIVIIAEGVGMDLEDLAAGSSPTLRLTRADAEHLILGWPAHLRLTQVACIVLAFLWIALLITVTALAANTWYLLLVGGLGMLQNVIVAGAKRSPAASGVHLERVEEFQRRKTMHVLMAAERAYPGVGRALVDEFFGGRLSLPEKQWWNNERGPYEKSADSDKAAADNADKPSNKVKSVRRAFAKYMEGNSRKESTSPIPAVHSGSKAEKGEDGLSGEK